VLRAGAVERQGPATSRNALFRPSPTRRATTPRNVKRFTSTRTHHCLPSRTSMALLQVPADRIPPIRLSASENRRARPPRTPRIRVDRRPARSTVIRYWDVTAEYAEERLRTDILIRLDSRPTAAREPAPAATCCPTLWFRNTWSWGAPPTTRGAGPEPRLTARRADSEDRRSL